MNKKHVRRNVVLYKLFVIFNEPLFWGPVVIASIQELGHMSLADIFFMESAVMVLCVLLNIPSGALADLIGQKTTIIIGRIFLLGSAIGFTTQYDPFTAWLANIMWAIGYSFQSGADVSFFYNFLKDNGLEKEFKKIEGCAVGSRLLLIAFCSLIVGPLAAINLRIPGLISIPFVIIPLVVAFFFEAPKVTKKYNAREQWNTMKEGLIYAIKKPEVRWIIGFCTLLMGASKIWFFTYNPYFEVVGISIQYYGVIFFIVNIIAWLSSHYAYKVEGYMSEGSSIIIMILCVAAPIILMGLVPYWPVAYMVVFQNVVRGYLRPFKGDYMNRHIKSDHIRTTVLSVQSSASDALTIVALAWFGFMTKHMSLLHSLTILGVFTLIVGMLSYGSYKKLPTK
jgi:MFS family permease